MLGMSFFFFFSPKTVISMLWGFFVLLRYSCFTMLYQFLLYSEVEFPVLYSRFLLVIYFIHISVCMSIPVSQFITPPPPTLIVFFVFFFAYSFLIYILYSLLLQLVVFSETSKHHSFHIRLIFFYSISCFLYFFLLINYILFTLIFSIYLFYVLLNIGQLS